MQATQMSMAPGGSMAFRHQHGLRWGPRAWTSLWLLVVARAIDINTDPSCGWATMDPDMALGQSSAPDVTVALGGTVSHSDQYGPGGSVALGHQRGLR